MRLFQLLILTTALSSCGELSEELKGEQGEAGVAGERGLTGMSGATGAKGEQGEAGTDGVNGTDGSDATVTLECSSSGPNKYLTINGVVRIKVDSCEVL